ncbi:serine protease [Streptomyces canus]|uniref:S1 family peptidase n=1 Tax=Streptomyces canus TaxID=58343 RepID=UPI0033B5D28C
MNRIKRARQITEGALPAITLVLVSFISTLVAILGLQTWVAIAAVAAVVVSGSQVLKKEVLIPWRIKAADNSVVRVWAQAEQGGGFTASAVQIAPRRWATAAHVVVRDSVELKLGDTWIQSRVIYRDEDLDLAVLAVDHDWPWLARISTDLPDPGSRIQVTGWTEGRRDKENRDRGLRAVQDYTVQGPVEESLIVLAGAVPPRGFSGAAVTEIDSGKVVAVLFNFLRGDSSASAGLPRLDEVHATPLSCIPVEYRR